MRSFPSGRSSLFAPSAALASVKEEHFCHPRCSSACAFVSLVFVSVLLLLFALCCLRGSSSFAPPVKRGLPLALPSVPYGRPVARIPPCITSSGASAESSYGPDSASVLEGELPPQPPDDLVSFWAVISQLEEHSSLLASVGLRDVSPMKLASL